jgi:hypothetical protein
LLAIDLIGSGFLAVPVLTGSSAYAVAEEIAVSTPRWHHLAVISIYTSAAAFLG